MDNLNKSRRRSFVDTTRRSMVLNRIFSDETEASTSQKSQITMDEYKDCLTKEKQQWNDILISHKKLCKESKERLQYEPMEIIESEVEMLLSADDKRFIDEKPNYLEMMNCVKKYVDKIRYLEKFKADVIERYDEAVNEVQAQTNLLVDKMCSDDLCELCNIKQCNAKDHKFSLQ